ncbi:MULTISPECIES: energy transducer TonB [Methylosinus]|uniref:Energy transducer TonB n=1 Tax=Methylosinus trichosporium (strain ATCC 35070 / NCIMB 11131 / UNIQEM 75 / OB3b) TaxID=595536 RepID=A0A2D2CWE1_METT3|nr:MULTISPECIES: TonB family protein [Methylosinus]ATQ67035.1 energy transducer TonB [Methylosinus trichosporium OB3b]OBS50837.1 energy transducer TonB [Methylosinus sp. 3S-1]
MSVSALWGASGGDRRVWSVAGVVALALHVTAIGAALFVAGAEPEDEDTGAPAIEISLAPAAPHVEDAPDAPPGPQADEAAAAAPAVASSQTKDSDDPKIARTEAEEADYTHAEKHEKPVEEPTKHEATPVVSAESAASVAAAPPKSDVAQEAPHAVAPAPGVDKAARAAKLTWQKMLIAHLNRHKRYPSGAGRRSAEVAVAFTLDRLGHVVASGVRRSSGDHAFDEAALAMMKRADPLPPPPAAVADEGLSFEVPVMFRAEKH